MAGYKRAKGAAWTGERRRSGGLLLEARWGLVFGEGAESTTSWTCFQVNLFPIKEYCQKQHEEQFIILTLRSDFRGFDSRTHGFQPRKFHADI